MFLDFFNKIINKIKGVSTRSQNTKKLGLALGSGGAKGMAHIGALRAFEEEGIKFNVISGCSIGSIIGGMYASGFSWASIVAYLKELNITDPQTLIKYKLSGVTTHRVIDRILGGANIEDFPLPYGAVATNLQTGEQVDFTRGNAALAMCASSAIPPLFKPFIIGDESYVDGAYVNNVPADLAKRLGADVVIGINLSVEKPTNEGILSILDDKYKGHGVNYCDRSKAGFLNSDLMICPNLTQFTSASVSHRALLQMEDIGYEETKRRMPEIKKLLKKRKIIAR